MNSQHGSPLKHPSLAAVLLVALLAIASGADAGPGALSEAARVGQPGEASIDAREDDVTVFFESGAYKQRLAVPLAAAAILTALVSVAVLATKRCRDFPVSIRQERDD